jgi:hypothetical protein
MAILSNILVATTLPSAIVFWITSPTTIASSTSVEAPIVTAMPQEFSLPATTSMQTPAPAETSQSTTFIQISIVTTTSVFQPPATPPPITTTTTSPTPTTSTPLATVSPAAVTGSATASCEEQENACVGDVTYWGGGKFSLSPPLNHAMLTHPQVSAHAAQLLIQAPTWRLHCQPSLWVRSLTPIPTVEDQ